MMPALQQFLYWASNALLLPALVGLIVLSIWTAILFGGLLREWLGRRAVHETFAELRKLHRGREGELLSALCQARAGLPARLATKLRAWPSAADRGKCLEDLELEVTASLARLTWITRVAPMLGLMGTLIPLGPALTALADGDVARLSSNLVVAFTTTVLGVFLGSAAYSMNLLRKGWYARDLSDLEHLFAHPRESSPPPDAHETP